jgi:hypothetical protein
MSPAPFPRDLRHFLGYLLTLDSANQLDPWAGRAKFVGRLALAFAFCAVVVGWVFPLWTQAFSVLYTFIGLIGVPLVLALVVDSWVGAGPAEAVARAPAAVGSTWQVLGLVLSHPVLAACVVFGVVALENIREHREASAIRAISATIRAGRVDVAERQLAGRLDQPDWLGEHAALAALLDLRAGRDAQARAWADLAARRAATHSGRGGYRMDPIDASTCPGYIAQVPVTDTTLRLELHARYCARLGDTFPRANPTLSPILWWDEPAPLHRGTGNGAGAD